MKWWVLTLIVVITMLVVMPLCKCQNGESFIPTYDTRTSWLMSKTALGSKASTWERYGIPGSQPSLY